MGQVGGKKSLEDSPSENPGKRNRWATTRIFESSTAAQPCTPFLLIHATPLLWNENNRSTWGNLTFKNPFLVKCSEKRDKAEKWIVTSKDTKIVKMSKLKDISNEVHFNARTIDQSKISQNYWSIKKHVIYFLS